MNQAITTHTTNSGKWHKTPEGHFYFVEEIPEQFRDVVKEHRRSELAAIRHRGMRRLTNEELRRIAAMNPPPPVWFDEDQEIPFA